jgi:hypothetical protein
MITVGLFNYLHSEMLMNADVHFGINFILAK